MDPDVVCQARRADRENVSPEIDRPHNPPTRHYSAILKAFQILKQALCRPLFRLTLLALG